ncbi:MAG: AAA family ATPase [Planctomycetota bacterium]
MDDDVMLLAAVSGRARATVDRVGEQIVGQEAVVKWLVVTALAGGHALLVGVPGLGKTKVVRALAGAMGGDFSRVQFTPDLMPGDVVGSELLMEGAAGGASGREMVFRAGPVFANWVLADEINRTPPRVQSALLEAMQEGQVTSGGVGHALPEPFMVVATQNPIEQEGTYPLPEAELDRFMVQLSVGYPDAASEVAIAVGLEGDHAAEAERARGEVWSLEGEDGLLAARGLVRRVPVAQSVAERAVAVVRGTRPGESGGDDGLTSWVAERVAWGAGPRGAQHLVMAARGLAVLEGEPTVLDRHVMEAARVVLPHRLVLGYGAVAEGVTEQAVVERVLEAVMKGPA